MPRTLKVGFAGADVVALQGALNQAPPRLPPLLVTDGIFGAKTLARVKAFQQNNGLVADGIVGPLTWDKLLGGQRPAFATHVNRIIGIGEKLSRSPSAWRLIGTPSYDELMTKLVQLKAEAQDKGYYGVDEAQKDQKPKPEPKPEPKKPLPPDGPVIIPREPAIAGVASAQQLLVMAFMASVAAVQAIAAVAVQNPPKLPDLPKVPPPLLVARIAGLTLTAAIQALNIKRTARELCKEKHPDRVVPCAEAIKELEAAEAELRQLAVRLTHGAGDLIVRETGTVTSRHLFKKLQEAQIRYGKALVAASKCLGCPGML